jgi:hypothetical protein
MLFRKPSSASSYKYKPLNTTKDEIRVLRILPGKSNEPLRCNLIHIPLTKSASYEALSYAWSDPNLFPNEGCAPKEKIWIDGQPLEVGKNLASFLWSARRKHGECGWLWIDAVCINQSDVRERNVQILRMRKIYKLARQVIVWLGPQYRESGEAIEFLQMIFEDCPQGSETAWFRSFLKEYSVAVQWKALVSLLGRVWWSRIWIVQEVVLARDVVLLSIHKLSAALGDISKFVQFHGGYEVVVDRVQLIGRLATIRRRRDDLSIVDVLDNIGSNDCSNMRDKIYGLLGMIKEAPLLVPAPNYKISTYEVYKGLFANLALKTGDLDFLSLIVNRADEDHDSTLPSWCPDPTSKYFKNLPRLNTALTLPPKTLPQFSASRGKMASPKISKDRSILTLPGICIDTIDGIFPGGSGEPFNLMYTVQARSRRSVYKNDRKTFEALWMSLVAGLDLHSTSNFYAAPSYFGDLFARQCLIAETQHLKLVQARQESAFDISDPLKNTTFVEDDSVWQFNTWYKYNRDALFGGRTVKSWTASHVFSVDERDGPASPTSPSAWSGFSGSWGSASFGRRMVTTEKGYIGNALELTRRGDIVCILFGCKMPVILRPKGRHFIFIGECYIHGLMFGEAMDGLRDGKFFVEEFDLH